jgi:hypothetical protein
MGVTSPSLLIKFIFWLVTQILALITVVYFLSPILGEKFVFRALSLVLGVFNLLISLAGASSWRKPGLL